MPVNQGSCESVKSTIRSNETNQHNAKSGETKINSVPAVRGGAGGKHFDGWPGTGTPMGGKK